MSKYCPCCETVLPVEQFHRNSDRPDGWAFYCRQCMAQYAKNWYDRTEKPKVIARQQERESERDHIRIRNEKKCSKCGSMLPRSAFIRHRRTLDGLQAYCRSCMPEYHQQYYKDHPGKHEQRKRRQAEWQRNLSPEKKKAARLRALLSRYGLTSEELSALYERCNYRCQVCKLHASEHTWKGLIGQLCVDHILRDGERIVRGLLCNRCNSLLGRLGDDRPGVMRYVCYLERYRASKKEKQDGC